MQQLFAVEPQKGSRYTYHMKIEQQSAFARAARSWFDLDQKRAAVGAGISERTLLDLEKGRACSDKTWTAVATFYASQGFEVREGQPLILLVR